MSEPETPEPHPDREQDCGIAIDHINGTTVHKRRTLVRGTAANLVVAGREDVLPCEIGGRATLWDNPRDQAYQSENIPAVQRHVCDCLALNDLPQGSVVDLEKWSLGRDNDLFGDIAHLQNGIDTSSLVNQNFNRIASIGLESGILDLHLVNARWN